jgi:hypothetical protein
MGRVKSENGFTHHQEADADYAFVVYAGPWRKRAPFGRKKPSMKKPSTATVRTTVTRTPRRPPGGCREQSRVERVERL